MAVKGTQEVLPLTDELMRARLAALAYTVSDEHGPIEETLFMSLRCDDCQRVVRLDRPGASLAGWTTRGDLHNGWDDWCPSCTAERALRR